MSPLPGRPVEPAELTVKEQAALGPVVRRLVAVEGSSTFLFDAVDPPVTGSKRDKANQSDLSDAFVHAGHLLYASEDHLQTILTIIKSKLLPSFALFTLARTAAEAEVRCGYLLDPRISESERLARGLNERLDNLIEQRKASGDHEFFVERVAHLVERASANGVAVQRAETKAGGMRDVTGFGHPLKSDLELFNLYLRTGASAFRYLGGHVHSKPWIQLPTHRAEPTADPKQFVISTQLNVVVFAALLESVLKVRELNVRSWLTLSGYPPDLWARATASRPPPV